MNNWYVITGAASVGKTTLINALANEGYHTVQEAATAYMQEQFDTGKTLDELRKDEETFQLAIAHKKALYESSQDPTELTFFDRGMHETVAFLRHFNIPIDTKTDALMRASNYKKVFILEPLDIFEQTKYRPNDKEDIEFVRIFTKLLESVYSEYGYTPVRVPAVSVEDRVKFVLSHLK